MKRIERNTYFFLSALSLVLFAYLFTNKLDKSYLVTSGVDAWEYHSVAVNFSEYNKFPLMGIYQADSIYQFSRFRNSEIDNYLFCRWYKSGVVYSFEKPPLYSLILGLNYKIFGVNIDNVYYQNLVFLTLIIYLVFLLGNQLFNRSWFFSFAAGMLYLLIGTFNGLSNVSPDLLLTFFVLCTIYYILKGRNRTDLRFFMGLGVLFALMSMTKGNIIFFILLYPLFVLIQFGVNKKFFNAISILFIFFVLTVSPWMIYANILRVHTSKISELWGRNLIKSEQSCQIEITDYDKIEESRRHQIDIIKENIHHKLVSHLWGDAYAKNRFIVLSNQFRPEEFLSLHNEYCINGKLKPEWRFIDNSYYNKYHLNAPPLLKIVYFYIEHPRLLYQISYMKVKQAIGTKFSAYCVSILLLGSYLLVFNLSKKSKRKISLLVILFFLGLYFSGFIQLSILLSISVFIAGVILYRKKHIKVMHYSLLLLLANSLLISIFIYGGERFVYFIDPISIIVSLMILESIFLDDHKSENIIIS